MSVLTDKNKEEEEEEEEEEENSTSPLCELRMAHGSVY